MGVAREGPLVIGLPIQGRFFIKNKVTQIVGRYLTISAKSSAAKCKGILEGVAVKLNPGLNN